MQWSGFEIGSERLIDYLWFFIKCLLYLSNIFLLNVPEKILIVCIAVRNALDHPHFRI